MSPGSWMLFALKKPLLCLTPGPTVLLEVYQGMRLGHRASVAGNIGVLSGNAAYFLISTLVLSPPCRRSLSRPKATWCSGSRSSVGRAVYLVRKAKGGRHARG